MATEPFDYGKYFEELQKVNLSVRLGGGGTFDGGAAITSLKGNLAWLDLYGSEQPPTGGVRPGAEVWMSVWTGGALCRCDARVETVRDDRQFSVRLTGEVKETQRREYFRLDVSLPLLYKVLDGITHEDAEADWVSDRKVYCRPPEIVPCGEGHKVIDWDGEDIAPVRVNLSGGGIRLRVSRLVQSGTLVKLTLFPSLPQPRPIYVVGEALRCQEITLSRQPGTHYSLSVKFILIVDRDREAIISYLFNEQRRELMNRNDRVSVRGAG